MTKLSTLTGALAVLLASSAFAPAFADADAALAELQNTVLSKGPTGEDPTPASELSLSDEELSKIKEMGATAAIVMHYGGNDWSRAQVEGLQYQFGEMGIEVIAVTDAGESTGSRARSRSPRSPALIVSPSQRLTARSTAFSNSRTFPGQSCRSRASFASADNRGGGRSVRWNRSRK